VSPADIRPSISIGLLWHSARSGNLGVGALTIANIAIVRQIAEEMGLAPRFLIVTMLDRHEAYFHAPDVGELALDGRNLLAPSGYWASVGKLDCLLDIGAGDSFTDIYSDRRFAFLWLTKVLAAARRKPLVFSPQTIGPFTKPLHRRLAAFALRRAASVVARDQMSFDAIHTLAPAVRRRLAVDVAFALPYVDQSGLRGGARTRVGVNVSGMLFNEAEAGRNHYGLQVDYAQLMRRFLQDLTVRPDIEVHLITHVTEAEGSWDDDAAVADRLAAEFPQVIRAANFAGPMEAKSYISGLDFLVAGRMHACIAAFSSGVPVVPVSYSRKFSGLFGLLDYPWMVPATGLNTDEALDFLKARLEGRNELAADVAKGMAKVETLLDGYRDELRRLFEGVSGQRTPGS